MTKNTFTKIVIASCTALLPSAAHAGHDSPQTIARMASSVRSDFRQDYSELDRVLGRLANVKVQSEVMRIGRSTNSSEKVQAYLNRAIGPKYPLEVTSLDTDWCIVIASITTKYFKTKEIKIGTTGKCKK